MLCVGWSEHVSRSICQRVLPAKLTVTGMAGSEQCQSLSIPQQIFPATRNAFDARTDTHSHRHDTNWQTWGEANIDKSKVSQLIYLPKIWFVACRFANWYFFLLPVRILAVMKSRHSSVTPNGQIKCLYYKSYRKRTFKRSTVSIDRHDRMPILFSVLSDPILPVMLDIPG